MSPLFRASLIAPAPVFGGIAFILLRPSYGVSDIASILGVAFLLTYGLLIVAGLPAHYLLQRVQWNSLPSYVVAFTIAILIVIAVATVAEGPPPPPLPDDNSPFAELTLKGGGWIIVFLISAPFVAFTAGLFWKLAVADPSEQ